VVGLAQIQIGNKGTLAQVQAAQELRPAQALALPPEQVQAAVAQALHPVQAPRPAPAQATAQAVVLALVRVAQAAQARAVLVLEAAVVAVTTTATEYLEHRATRTAALKI
jgi:hypothetical protein